MIHWSTVRCVVLTCSEALKLQEMKRFCAVGEQARLWGRLQVDGPSRTGKCGTGRRKSLLTDDSGISSVKASQSDWATLQSTVGSLDWEQRPTGEISAELSRSLMGLWKCSIPTINRRAFRGPMKLLASTWPCTDQCKHLGRWWTNLSPSLSLLLPFSATLSNKSVFFVCFVLLLFYFCFLRKDLWMWDSVISPNPWLLLHDHSKSGKKEW